jgi:hypothetical protein
LSFEIEDSNLQGTVLLARCLSEAISSNSSSTDINRAICATRFH